MRGRSIVASTSELLSLIGELELDKELVEQLVARHGNSLERLSVSAREEYDYAAVGYSLRSIHSVIESLLRHFTIDVSSSTGAVGRLGAGGAVRRCCPAVLSGGGLTPRHPEADPY